MKRCILSLVLACAALVQVCAAPIKDHRVESDRLNQLYNLFGISPENAVAETQRHWLRKAGQERWEMQELSLEKKKDVIEWARNQGIFDAWKPSLRKYHQALILGATTERMQMRLDDLKQMWNQGVRFDEIVWLTGERPLDPQVDQFLTRCQTESDAAVYLWETASLPKEMRALPVRFIRVPMKGTEGNLKRPNTEDTLVAWLQTTPQTGNYLFVSDQPFCGYQFAVIKGVIPDHLAFEVVGRETNSYSHPAGAAITLDAIARWIYQEKVVNSKK